MLWPISLVRSFDPSLTRMISKSGYVSASSDAGCRSSVSAALYAQTTTETRGQVRCCSARKRRVREGRRPRPRRRLRLALAIDQAELPVVDGVAAAPPLVGPRERDRAAGAFLERRADVHRGDVGLSLFALAHAVGARFGEQQRLVAGDVLQPRQIGAQLRLAMQVDVEGADVEEREIEKFGRRKVDVGEQAVGRRGLGVLIECAQKALDADAAVPAHDARRNLVAEREGQDRRMVGQLRDARDDVVPDARVGARGRRETRRAATRAARP